MLIIAGTVDLLPEDRDAFLADRAEPTRETRQESGCVEFIYTGDSLNLGRCRFLAIWESKEDFAAHAEIVKSRNQSAPSPVNILNRNLVQYEIGEVTVLQ